jgi:uncharacterized protein (TIGR00369 family)
MTDSAAPSRTAADQARLEAEIVEMIEQRTPFQKSLGVKVQALQPQLVLRFDWRPDLVGHFQSGRLHGGVIAAVLDSLGGCALMMGLADKHPQDSLEQLLHRLTRIGTIDMRVDYLRPGLGAFFVASAEITRLGGRVGSTQMRLHSDDGVLVATAAASYIVS